MLTEVSDLRTFNIFGESNDRGSEVIAEIDKTEESGNGASLTKAGTIGRGSKQ